MSDFSFTTYKHIFQTALDRGYQIITLKDFFSGNYNQNSKILVNRIDVDVKIERLIQIRNIYHELNIVGTVFLRLHSPAYNLLSIGNINVINGLLDINCEVGLHTELEDVSGYCGIEKKELLRKEIELFEILFSTKIYGTASHGDMTHFNNLNFWKANKAKDFDLLYEAYDAKLWNNCRYVSDSEWTQWKAYENGQLIKGDRRSPIDHIKDGVNVLHLLTHPESWYDKYIYE